MTRHPTQFLKRVGGAPPRTKQVNLVLMMIALLLIAVTVGVLEADGAVQGQEYYRCPGCNVVYIDVLNLRPDHVGAYGYARNTTPTIDRLASKSLVFKEVYAPEVHTVRSIFSTFSSLYPSQHQVNQYVLRNETPPASIALAHRSGGMSRYRKVGVIPHRTLKGIRFGTGFDTLVDDHPGQIAAALTGHGEEPFLLYYQNVYLHRPIYPPPRYSEMFPGTDPAFRDYLRALLNRSEHVAYQAMLDPEKHSVYEQEYLERLKNSSLARHYVSEYDGSVRQADDRIQTLLDTLDAAGLLNDTIIIVTAPHALPLGEGGRWTRQGTYRVETHVPLIISLPDMVEMRHISTPLQTIDIWPTLLDILAVDHDAIDAQAAGRSLLPLLDDRQGPRPFVLTEITGGTITMTNLGKGMQYIRLPNDRDRVVNWSRSPDLQQPLYSGTSFEEMRTWFQETYHEELGRNPFTPAPDEVYPYYAK